MDQPRFNQEKMKQHLSIPDGFLTILQPTQILADPKRQELIQRIKQLNCGESVTENAARFENLIMPLLNNLCFYYQRLPETASQHYTHLGGAIDYALNRTEASLQLAQAYLLKEGTNAHTEEQLLWLYALTTAGLLINIGKLYTDYSIQLHDVYRPKKTHWNPLRESLAKSERCYQYAFQKEAERQTRHRLTVLLARQLMPTQGFDWLISNSSVLLTWLALLHEDREGAGTLGALLDYADAIAIQRYLAEYILRMGGGGKSHRIGTFIDKPQKSTLNQEQLIGAEFLQWLKKSLEKGDITPEQKLVWISSGGLVMSPETFDLFMKDFPGYRPKQAIQKGLFSWGYTHLGANGRIFMSQPGLLMPLKDMLTKETAQVLSSQGQWIAHQPAATSIKPSHRKNG
jgi:integrating conjugative element relaxase (TIGR03760 family)